jgi:ABC-type glycerol-3-phosphate transport system permease component
MFGMFDQNGPAHEGLNFRQKMVVLAMNLFLLAELTFSIYLGQQDKENIAAIFLSTFLPMVIVTLFLARVFVRRMGWEAGSKQ